MIKQISFFSVFLFVIMSGISGCSKDEIDPSDSMSSVLSGEYGNGKFWTLNTILNGDTVKTDGFVRFDTKPQAESGNFSFVDVIPGEPHKEFKQIPLTSSEAGVEFMIDYTRKSEKVHISGIVTFGQMTVDMTLSE